jgi:hypothetical protein
LSGRRIKASKAAIKDASFQKICEIHETMKKSGRKDALPRLLLEMVDRCVMEFLVAYVYLENSIPKEYDGHNFTYLGRASELPALLLSLGVVYNPTESEAGFVQCFNVFN